MPKDFTLSPDANHDVMVPALGSIEVRRGETVTFPDEYVEGLRGQDQWIPSGWAWDPLPEPAPQALPENDEPAPEPAQPEEN